MDASGKRGAGGLMGGSNNDYHDQVGHIQIPFGEISSGHEVDLEIINQYGQLMGEYSRLDDELWLSHPGDDDDSLAAECSDELESNAYSSHENTFHLDLLTNCLDKSGSHGGANFVKNTSCTTEDSSQNIHLTSSPVSVLQKRSFANLTPSTGEYAQAEQLSDGICRTNYSATEAGDAFQSEEYLESFNLEELSNSIPTKGVRTRKVSELLQAEQVKKCVHCESTTTPQWRDGPMGPKTLCNACGMALKAGRLIPGYRPFKSSTSDPSLHDKFPKSRECNPSTTLKLKKVKPKRAVDTSEVDQNCGPEASTAQEMTEETTDWQDSDSMSWNRKPISQTIARKKHRSGAVKKCLHCESTKTPQWRGGPMGRNTLCNACGVQFIHGRLFPEYRPLRSPTYNPSLHSHLPKQVQRMRKRKFSEK